MRGFSRLDNGDVQLTMHGDDYDRLLLICGAASQAVLLNRDDSFLTLDKVLGWINRVTVPGNSNMLPYEVSEQEQEWLNAHPPKPTPSLDELEQMVRDL